MQSIGGRKLLALAVSSLAAIALLAVAGWMLLGGSDQPTASAVQIIPPAADDGPKDDRAETAAGQSNADTAVASRAGAAARSATDAPAAAASASSPASAAPPDEIAVYLTGAVVKPGVYAMRPGQRLADALELAGGPTGDAALHRINLAAYLADAAHYRIPAVGEAEAPAVASPPAAASPPSGAVAVAVAVAPVAGGSPAAVPAAASSSPAASCAKPLDINTATADCLQTLPGIGRVRAESIVAHRQQAGPFAAIEGITEVSGIGSGIYGQIAKLITAGPR